MASRTARGNLVPPGKSVQQAKDRLYYIARRKLGISKADLGVTPHGLRHEFALNLYEAEAGAPAALRGGEAVERTRDLAARQEVTNQLGHSRPGITGSYTGPRPKGRPSHVSNSAVETKLPLPQPGAQS
jgi:integrase